MKYIALFSMVLTAACARSVTQAAPPTPSPAQLQQQLQAARSAVQCYSAEIRLTYFGPEGRLRGSANLLVQRPDHLRYELLGPHGGPLMAAVTDGNSMQAVDYKENRFVHGTATPAHLDALLQWAPLHLTPAGWVMLLFGEVDVPAAARVSFDAETRAWLAQVAGRRADPAGMARCTNARAAAGGHQARRDHGVRCPGDRTRCSPAARGIARAGAARAHRHGNSVA